jgi:hypothetical protein
VSAAVVTVGRSRSARGAGLGRRFIIGVVAGAVAVAGLVPAIASIVGHRHAPRPEAARFAAAIDELSREGGQVVVEGLQQGLRDIASRSLTDATLATMADGWVARLRQLEGEVAAVPAPSAALRQLRDRYGAAIAGYRLVAETLRAAVSAGDGAARDGLVARAAEQGRAADRAFDAAAAQLRRVRGGM